VTLQQQPQPASIPWYQSRTIWAALVTAVFSAVNATGVQIDPFWQDSTVNILTTIGSLVSICVTVYYRVKARPISPLKQP
jgi:hypothetical protein